MLSRHGPVLDLLVAVGDASVFASLAEAIQARVPVLHRVRDVFPDAVLVDGSFCISRKPNSAADSLVLEKIRTW